MRTIRTIAVLFVIAKTANGGYYQCYVDGGGVVGFTPVDISYSCCSDTMVLYDANNGALERDLTDCVEEFKDSIAYNPEKYCSYDFSKCTFDYDMFSCDDEFKTLCSNMGGQVIEADLQVHCSISGYSLSAEFLNKIDCIAPSCSDSELLEVFQTVANQFGDCSVSRYSNFRINGVARPSLSYSSSSTGDNNDKDNVGLIVGCVLGGLAVLIMAIVLVVMVARRKKENNDTVGPLTSSINGSKSVAVGNTLEQPGPSKTPQLTTQAGVCNETRYEVINPDGTMTVSTVLEYPDGSKSITETIIPASRENQGMQGQSWESK